MLVLMVLKVLQRRTYVERAQDSWLLSETQPVEVIQCCGCVVSGAGWADVSDLA